MRWGHNPTLRIFIVGGVASTPRCVSTSVFRRIRRCILCGRSMIAPTGSNAHFPVIKRHWAEGLSIPQSAPLPAPFTQGGLWGCASMPFDRRPGSGMFPGTVFGFVGEAFRLPYKISDPTPERVGSDFNILQLFCFCISRCQYQHLRQCSRYCYPGHSQ